MIKEVNMQREYIREELSEACGQLKKITIGLENGTFYHNVRVASMHLSEGFILIDDAANELVCIDEIAFVN